MKSIYLDNAATTEIDSNVIEYMAKSMAENYGNPSSTHQLGRKAKSAIETARKNIAKWFNASASEIIFTAGGTEADNLILQNAVLNLGVKKIITSKIEHHAVLHTCHYLEKDYNIDILYVDLDKTGQVNLENLEVLLSNQNSKTLVSLMHINNEIGNILPLKKVSDLCIKYNALFHSDTVQTIGHYKLDLKEIPIDFITCSAHKFHGPKGVGFAYFKKGFGIKPMFYGGDQEKGARSSTENVHSILGMDKALDIAYINLEKDSSAILEIKSYFIEQLANIINNVEFNGLSQDLTNSSYTILNVRFPTEDDFLFFNLDMFGIAVSAGSACQSGSSKGSHVLAEILDDKEISKTSVRFSFSKFTSKQDIDIALSKIKELLK